MEHTTKKSGKTPNIEKLMKKVMSRDKTTTVREFLTIHGFVGSQTEMMRENGVPIPSFVTKLMESMETQMLEMMGIQFMESFCDQIDDIMDFENDVPVLIIQMNKPMATFQENENCDCDE